MPVSRHVLKRKMLLKGIGEKKLRIVRFPLLFIITIFFKSTICLDRFHQNWTFSSLVVYPGRLKLLLVDLKKNEAEMGFFFKKKKKAP